MRALAVALLLSVPLSAGDRSSLDKAVELFKSPDAAQRAAGSQMAERELRRLLAPLLEAMESDDPEVRRRARRSILSLVPDTAEKEPQTAAEIEAALVELRARQAQLLKVLSAQTARRFHEARKQRASRLLAGFGIHGACNRVKLQRGRVTGFRVLGVPKDSPAARLGLRTGDLILHLNGEAAMTVHGILKALGQRPDWDRVTVSVWRDNQLVRLPKK